MEVTVKVEGTKELQRTLEKLGERAQAELEKALYAEAELIMTESKKQCPVDTGTLRSTGYVRISRAEAPRTVVEMVYGGPAAPYAVAVHENPRAGKTGGVSPSGQRYKTWAKTGKWKYLEDPVKAATPKLPSRLARRLRRVIE
ncbi:MAG: HK97 gp10 family phage protein [Deltaproteobacteria bacterium]|nr:HK97 gp10 family phage protein [Deltaproteobacteria bacterium]